MWISVGVVLAMSLVGALTAAQASKRTARTTQKSTEIILLGAILTLTFLFGGAAMLLSIRGLAFLWFAKGTLLLTGALAVICTAFGLMRGLRSGSGVVPRTGSGAI